MSRPRIFSRDDRLRVRLRQSADAKPKGARLPRPKVSGVATKGSTVRGSMRRPIPKWHQRVTVKIKYRERFGNGPRADKSYSRALARQVGYNTRTHAEAKVEGVSPLDSFDAKHDRISPTEAREAVLEWGGDRRYWKMIISPERGNDMKDFLSYVREVMAAIERDVLTAEEIKAGERLPYLATIHDDTDHKHAHVIFRGRIGDRDLSLNKAYLSHGIRARASEIATKHLGYRLGDGRVSADTGSDPADEQQQKSQQKERAAGRSAGMGI